MKKSANMRFLAFMLALVLVLSVIPFNALAVEYLNTTVLDGKVKISTDGVSGKGSAVLNDDGTVTVTSQATSNCSGGKYTYTANAHTVLVTNNTEAETLMVEFAYSASGLGSLTIDGTTKTATPSGTYSKSLAPGESITIVVTSPASGSSSTGATATIVLSEFALKDTGTKAVTVAKTEGGTVTVDGTELTADSVTVNTDYATGVAVTAKPASGYVFLGWVDANGNVLSTLASATIQPLADMTVAAAFVADDQQGYWLGNGMLFTDLNEAAAAAASGDKTVVLLKDATLTAGTYTIPAGVKVIIPYDEAITNYGAAPELMPNGTAWVTPTPYRTLTMASGAKLVVNGELELAAKHHVSSGSGSIKWGGAIYGKYGHIDMADGAALEVNGTLYAWGVVSGEGVVTAYSGGTIYEKMQVNDYRGGTATSALATTYSSRKLFPFSQYYVQNVEAKEVIHSGATLMVDVGVYLSAPEQASVAFVGSSGAMFTMADGAYVTKEYDAVNDRLLIDVYGNTALSSIALSFEGQTVNSSSFRLGINNNIDINIHSGVTTINQEVVLQAGATVTVDREATLYNTTNLYVMDAEDWGTYARGELLMPVKWSYANGTTVKRTSVTDAMVDINGTIINAGQVFSSGSESIISSGKTGVYALLTPATGSDSISQLDHNSFTLGMTSDWVEIAFTAAILVNGDGTTVTAEGSQYDAYIYDSLLDKWVQKNIYNEGAGYTVTVTYDPNNGTGTAFTTAVDYFGTAYAFINSGYTTMTPYSFAAPDSDFTREGYTFIGWSTDANATTAQVIPGAYIAVSADTTLYAVWSPNSYSLIIEGIEGETSVDVPYGSDLSGYVPAAPTKDGYKFLGWTASMADGTALDTVPTTMPAYDIIFTANWEEVKIYTLTFTDENGEVLAEYEYEEGAAVDATYPSYTKDNYTISWSAAIPSALTEDVEISAIATPNVYTVTFVDGMTDLGESEANEENGWMAPMMTAPTKTGYTFLGWSTDPYATEADAAYSGTEAAITESVILYAIWDADEYTVTFISTAFGTETVICTETVEYGQSVVNIPTVATEGEEGYDVLPAYWNDNRYGYVFNGWDDETIYTGVESDLTVRSVYVIDHEIEYQLTIADDDGSALDYLNKTWEATVTEEELAAYIYEKEGYSFAGWYIDGTEVTFPYTVTGDVTITAKWEVNEYTITWYGVGEPIVQTYKYGEAIVAPADPTMEHYDFAGWVLYADNSTVEIPATMPAANLEFAASWTPVSYTISWDTDGDGDVDTTTAVTYNSYIGTTPDAVVPGMTATTVYSFNGWLDQNGASVDASTIVTGDMTVTAQFTSADRNYYLVGDIAGGWSAVEENKLIRGEDGKYTFQIKLDAGTYEFKILSEDAWFGNNGTIYDTTNGYEWIFSTSEGSNCKLTSSALGTYTFTFNVETNGLMVDYVPDHVHAYTASFSWSKYNAVCDVTYTCDCGSVYTASATVSAEEVDGQIVFTATCGEDTDSVTVDDNSTYAIYFDNSNSNWDTVNAYCWNASTSASLASWPGAAMTALGDGLYVLIVPAEYDMIIFNDGQGTQSYDIQIPTNGCNTAVWYGDTDVRWGYNEPAEHTITFQVDGEATDSYSYFYGDIIDWNAIDENVVKPEKEGHTFAGYDYTNAPAYVDGDITITGSFTINSYTVTFVDDDGTVLSEQAVTYGQMPVAPADPTKAKDGCTVYTFAGWDNEIVAATGNATYTATYTESLSHTEGEVQVENEIGATCTVDGSYDNVVYCSACGEELSREAVTVPAPGHSYDAVVTAPTCTEDGYTTYTCSVCGDTYVADEVAALGHSYDAVVTAPTCTEDGYTTYTCSVCGDSYVADEVAALGHSYDAVVTAPTCTEGGYTTYTCSVCGDSYVADEVEALGHSYDAVITAPTCTEDGYTTYTCSACGDTYVADEVAALGHSYDAVVTAPTCTEGGYTTYTCSACGDTYVADEVAALGHGHTNGLYYEDCGDGTHDVICDDCSAVIIWAEEHIYGDGKYICDCGAAYTGIYQETNGDLYYVENGVAVKNKGLVKTVDADGHIHYYYFGCNDAGTCSNPDTCGGEYKAQKSGRHWAFHHNGYLIEWAYTFGDDGVIVHNEDTSLNGVNADENGVDCYYMDGVKVAKGLFVGDDGYYYYARSNGALVKGQSYYISNNNGLDLPKGTYQFNELGQIVLEQEVKNGFVYENGAWYYYVDGTLNYAGLIWCDGPEGGDEGWYYVNSKCKLVTGCDYWISKNNGHMKNATYTFDENGTMVLPEVKNGFYYENDAWYYYVDGTLNYAGLIWCEGPEGGDEGWYYVNSKCRLVTGCDYYISKNNDQMKKGTYTFDENGTMVITVEEVKNGFVYENGAWYYYVDGTLNYAGLIWCEGPEGGDEGWYYVNSKCKLVTGCTYWISKNNGHMKNGNYTFDENGTMITE